MWTYFPLPKRKGVKQGKCPLPFPIYMIYLYIYMPHIHGGPQATPPRKSLHSGSPCWEVDPVPAGLISHESLPTQTMHYYPGKNTIDLHSLSPSEWVTWLYLCKKSLTTRVFQRDVFLSFQSQAISSISTHTSWKKKNNGQPHGYLCGCKSIVAIRT